MTFSPRRVLALFAVILVVGWATAADPTPPPGPPPTVAVDIEPTSGPAYTATFFGTVIRIKTDFGLVILDVVKVKLLDLQPNEDGTFAASVTLVDKSHLTGTLAERSFAIVRDGQAETLNPAAIAQIKFNHPKDTSLFAAIIGLLTLTLMEIVLGVDNVIFLAIVAGRLPIHQRPKARGIGLAAALGTRILLLLTLTFLLGLTKPLFTLPAMPFFETLDARAISWRDLILLIGGSFLIGKSVYEMHEKLEHAATPSVTTKTASFAKAIVTIAVIDIVFSLDSVITAVGMVDERWVMIVAMVLAMGVMLFFAGPISHFVESRPTVKVLALSFLILIGVLLVAEGLGQHMDKGYIYFAMAFAVVVELINIRLRGTPVERSSQ